VEPVENYACRKRVYTSWEWRGLACGLLGKRQRAQNPHPAAQARRHDVGVYLPENSRGLDVPVE